MCLQWGENTHLLRVRILTLITPREHFTLQDCIVCQELYAVGSTLVRLPCGHLYHEVFHGGIHGACKCPEHYEHGVQLVMGTLSRQTFRKRFTNRGVELRPTGTAVPTRVLPDMGISAYCNAPGTISQNMFSVSFARVGGRKLLI